MSNEKNIKRTNERKKKIRSDRIESSLLVIFFSFFTLSSLSLEPATSQPPTTNPLHPLSSTMETLLKDEATSPARHGQGTTAGGGVEEEAGAAAEMHASTTPTKERRRLKKKSEIAAVSSPSVPTPAKKAPVKKKGKAAPAPEAKAPAAKREKKGKGKAVKKEEVPSEVSSSDEDEDDDEMKIEKPPSKKSKGKSAAPETLLPPPLGTAHEEKTTKKTKGKAKKPSKDELSRLPGWQVEKGASDSDPGFFWKAYGDLSRMPKTDSIVAVSLNNGVVQVKRREGGEREREGFGKFFFFFPLSRVLPRKTK